MPVCGNLAMSGRLLILNSILLLGLASFPAIGLLLTYVVGPSPGPEWAVLLVVSSLGSLTATLLARRAGWSEVLAGDETAAGGAADDRLAGSSGWILGLLAVLAFLPMVVAVLGSPRVQISHHGYFHSAYVYQVIAGYVPPENVTLPGHASNTYWPYHALLAAIVELFAVPAPLASAALNLILLAGSVGWSAANRSELYGPARRGLGVLLAVFGLFGANLFGGLYWLLFAAAGMPLEPRTMVLLGDVRLSTLLAKFANYTGAALGVYFYLFVILIAVRLLRGRVRGFDLLLAAMALLGAFALHSITGAFMAAGFVPALACAALAARWGTSAWSGEVSPRRLGSLLRDRFASRAARGRLVLAAAALLLLGLPVLAFMANASSEFPTPPTLGLPDAYALSVVATSYPLLPFFCVGVAQAIRRRDARLLFLALVCLGGYALASVLSISGRNEYKFIYLGSVGLCLVALGPITELLRDRRPGFRRILAGVAWVALLLPCLNLALFGVAQLRGPLFADQTFAYEGRHVTAEPQPALMPGTGLEYTDLFMWIRGHTPLDTVVVVPLIQRDRSVLYVLSERVPYVVDGMHYNRGLPDYERRASQVEALYGWQATREQRARALQEIALALPGRPLVVVYPRHFEKRFDPALLGLERVHEGVAADLYVFPRSVRAEPSA